MKRITLTFDNGPCPKTTPRVLDVLKEHQLTGYFCVVGRQLSKGEEQRDLARETHARGHRIINHSMTHGTALGDDPTEAHATREILEAHQLLKQVVPMEAPWFRPFGRGGELGTHLLSRAALAHLKEQNYSVLLWNSVPRDWEDTNGWVETALREVGQQDHTVLVLHDLPTGAMRRLESFLDQIQNRGFEFTTELPEDCVPMRNGKPCWEPARFDQLVTH